MSTAEICWCVSGRIEQGELVTDFCEAIKIKSGQELAALAHQGIWKCIPSTDSTGDVTGVSLVEKLEQIAPSY
ncbi:hypothetical protein WKK05_37540 (plasmid) [Nostoc sp. UHCC 0302]|uniref:hypothetical protein n=1 Tax=Nostoc sp. UHCC 0302 TaxID=3134896 RepID=UPI00311CB0BF